MRFSSLLQSYLLPALGAFGAGLLGWKLWSRSKKAPPPPAAAPSVKAPVKPSADRQKQLAEWGESTQLPSLNPTRWAQLYGPPPHWEPTGEGDGVRIDPEWNAANLIQVATPQLAAAGVKNSAGGLVKSLTLHKAVVPSFFAMLEAWQQEGVLGDVLTLEALNQRMVRGNKTAVSNHSFGTAIDVNAQWNPRGTLGAAPGEYGSVHRLLPGAEKAGWFNGRFYGPSSQPDPHHFEASDPRPRGAGIAAA